MTARATSVLDAIRKELEVWSGLSACHIFSWHTNDENSKVTNKVPDSVAKFECPAIVVQPAGSVVTHQLANQMQEQRRRIIIKVFSAARDPSQCSDLADAVIDCLKAQKDATPILGLSYVYGLGFEPGEVVAASQDDRMYNLGVMWVEGVTATVAYRRV